MSKKDIDHKCKRAASMTKPLTSVAAMILMEEGALQLTDPVAKFPQALADLEVSVMEEGANGEVSYSTAPVARPVTVLEDRVFGPLGMEDSGFHVPENALPRLAEPFAVDHGVGPGPLLIGTGATHSGSASGWARSRGSPRVDPEEGLTAVLMSQRARPDPGPLPAPPQAARLPGRHRRR